MPWWLLSYLRHIIDPPNLTSITRTHQPGHLFMMWSYIKPTRIPIWRRVRGTSKFCGFFYRWTDSHIQEQVEEGETLDHTVNLTDLIPNVFIYYYLFSPPDEWPRLNQSQLITVFTGIPEAPPYAGLVYTHTKNYPIGGYDAPIQYDLLAYDYGGITFPDGAPQFIVLVDGIYLIECHHTWQPELGNYRNTKIKKNNSVVLAEMETDAPFDRYPAPYHHLSIQVPLVANDDLRVTVRHPFFFTLGQEPDEPLSPRFSVERIA